MIKLKTAWTLFGVAHGFSYKGKNYGISGKPFPKDTLTTDGWHYSFLVEFGFTYRKWVSRIIGWNKAYGYSRTYKKTPARLHLLKD